MQSNSSDQPRQWPSIGPKCPLAARKKVGLFNPFSSSSAKDNFHNVILLVSSNYAYYDFLQNWEYLANQLDLQWAVLALDQELYDTLGPERAIPPEDLFSVSGSHPYREKEFNKLSCNKMRMVMSITENCGMDVVFCDVDNIFYENPFEDDLGRLIASQRYDYIYQSNDPLVPPGKPLQDQCLHGRPREEANTGFYFVSRESKVIKSVVNHTLEICSQPTNTYDDQKLFWRMVWKAQKWYRYSYHHCNVQEYLEPSTHNIHNSMDAHFNFCCMDPYYYPVGHPDNHASKTPVTFHANWILGKENKTEKLRMSRSDHHGWDESRIVKEYVDLTETKQS